MKASSSDAASLAFLLIIFIILVPPLVYWLYRWIKGTGK